MIIFHIALIAVLTAVACALLGVFLVQRKMSLMSDAISHSVLPGIVVALLLVDSLHSPWLILGASLSGILMVFLVETINRTGLVKEDAAMGLVFPALFSLGVILVSQGLENVHFHESTVLVGDIALSALDQARVGGQAIGPKSLYVMASVLLLDLLFVLLFFKELKITTFDPDLAATFGFRPGLMHYLFMGLVSITAVAAFDAVGSILVIALMIAPASAAYLLTDNLAKMLAISALLAALSALFGFFAATWANASPSGSMAMSTGLAFLLAYLFAPGRGMLAQRRVRLRNRRRFSLQILLVHISNHSDTSREGAENSRATLPQHIRLSERFLDELVRLALRQGLLTEREGVLHLTEQGQALAHRRVVQDARLDVEL